MSLTFHDETFTGHCLCGAVAFHGRGLRDIVYCHCTQCRRQHGTVAAYSATRIASFVIEDDAALAWFEASPRARRGFCARCGSTLFWAPADGATIGIAAGAIDPGTRLAAVRHIYTDDERDPATLADPLPKYRGSMLGGQGNPG